MDTNQHEWSAGFSPLQLAGARVGVAVMRTEVRAPARFVFIRVHSWFN